MLNKQLNKSNKLTSYVFRPCRSHLQAGVWNVLGSIEIMCGKGDLASYRFLRLVWSFGLVISLLTGFCYKSGLSGWYLKHTRKYTDHVQKEDLASYRFLIRVCSFRLVISLLTIFCYKSGLSGWYLKLTRKYTDHVRKGDLALFRFLLQVCSLLITDFGIKIWILKLQD